MGLARMCFKINGVERFVVCDLEKDSLAEVLRRMGLTGVKGGCATGVCGACSVILNGEVVRSCTKKMKRVPEYSELRFTWVGDVGVVGNMLSVEGQGYGGLSHSVDMIPDDINLVFLETPRPAGPHGSCGCSEVFQSSGHMAVINAINNACGVRVYALPATPEKVKAGWEAKQRGEDLTPPKYFLGSDLEDELAMIRADPL